MENPLKYKKEILYHELGHWIVAKEFQFRVGDIEIYFYQTIDGYYHEASSQVFPMPHINNIASLETYLENRICILYTGVASQQLYEKRNTDVLIEEWGIDDNKKIKELMFILRGINFDKKEIRINLEKEHILQLIEKCWKKTELIINENSKIIKNMVMKQENEIILNERNILKYKILNEQYNKS